MTFEYGERPVGVIRTNDYNSQDLDERKVILDFSIDPTRKAIDDSHGKQLS